jgi:carboxypeptidase PM20D1
MPQMMSDRLQTHQEATGDADGTVLGKLYSYTDTNSPINTDGFYNVSFHQLKRHNVLTRFRRIRPGMMMQEETMSINYAEHLSKAISFPTVYQDNLDAAHKAAFVDFRNYLATAFPRLHSTLKQEVIENYSLLYTWKGSNPKLKPILLIAHMDVVPVEQGTEAKWKYPAFGENIDSGYIWGRGSMDDKVSMMGVMEAVESLLASGYQPQRDIYLAFGHDEEVHGNGAAGISAELEKRGLYFDYILDEGGGIADGLIPQVDKPVAFVGIAEKGYLTLQLDANVIGGHSSAPANEGAVGVLARAIYRLQDHPFHSRLTTPVRQMFHELSRNMPGVQGFVAKHTSLFAGLIKNELADNAYTSSLIQTTIAPTIVSGGVQDNVMPTTAKVVINFRLLHGETSQSVINHVKRAIHDKRVTVTAMDDVWEPSKVTSIKSRSYRVLRKTIQQLYPNTTVAPDLNVSLSDSRHYASLTDNILRFVPLQMHTGDIERIHGTNERIAVSTYKSTIKFYYAFIVNSDSQL